MREFNSIAAFAEHLATAAVAEYASLQKGLEAVAKKIEKTAKAELGHLQAATGPFPEWAELADATVEWKEHNGYVFNSDYNPLLNTGELMNSIHHEVNGLDAVIGSDSDIAAYQEFGTEHIPPRPFLGPAAFKTQDYAHRVFGAAAVSGIIGGEAVHEALGYDFSTD